MRDAIAAAQPVQALKYDEGLHSSRLDVLQTESFHRLMELFTKEGFHYLSESSMLKQADELIPFLQEYVEVRNELQREENADDKHGAG